MKTVFGGYIVKDAPMDAPEVSSPIAVKKLLKRYACKDREHFIALYMNVRNHVIVREVVSVGTLTASLVHPREVFKGAILANAAGIVVAHNHPSGDIRASHEDRETTKRLVEAGRLLGIPLLDHVIIGPKMEGQPEYFSFREAGLLS